MRLYMDEDSSYKVLVKCLRAAGHDVRTTAETGSNREKDPAQLTRAIRDGRVFLTKNYDDFKLLHFLIEAAGGHHPGILVVREDNDPARDMTPRGVVVAIGKLAASGIRVADDFVVLNQWR